MRTYEEITRDYDVADSLPTAPIKRQLASKYNAASSKAADIKNAILLEAREVRKERTEFTEEDVKWFNRLATIEMYKKAVEWLSQENRMFVEYLLSYYKEHLVNAKLFDKLHFVNERYDFSYSQKSLMKKYINTERYLKESKPEEVAKKKSDVEIVEEMFHTLKENMVSFHDEYMKSVENHATTIYNKLTSKEYQNTINTEVERLWNELENIRMGRSYNEYVKESKSVRAKYDEYVKQRSRYRAFCKLYASLEQYITKCRVDAEATYNSNVMSIADRLKNKEFNVKELTVSSVGSDPKFFSMMIADNEKKVYCRSILAAEYSDKMVPHFRFIITDRK